MKARIDGHLEYTEKIQKKLFELTNRVSNAEDEIIVIKNKLNACEREV